MERKVSFRIRRIVISLIMLLLVGVWLVANPESYEKGAAQEPESCGASEPAGGGDDNGRQGDVGEREVSNRIDPDAPLATEILDRLEVKGRAPKTGYKRTEFYNGWPNVDGCSLRQIIIKREVGESAKLNGCDVVEGSFTEPYTGQVFTATKKSDFSSGIQIDHIVALSDAWQKGAQYKTKEERYDMATDPLNLIAADAKANQQKSDGDAATWLPKNKAFRCQYVARQVSVKYKYGLWVTQAEHDAIARVLEGCPNERVVGV